MCVREDISAEHYIICGIDQRTELNYANDYASITSISVLMLPLANVDHRTQDQGSIFVVLLYTALRHGMFIRLTDYAANSRLDVFEDHSIHVYVYATGSLDEVQIS